MPSELGPTHRVLEDLQPYFLQIELPFQLIDIDSAAKLYQFLGELSTTGRKPILHLDMHGNKDGLSIAQSNELAPWEQVVPRFQAINVAIEGTLCVVAGVCYAFHAIKQISIIGACPVHMLIAPEDIVTNGFLEDGLVPFYKSIFEHGDITDAHAQYLGNSFRVFNADRFFVIAFVRYIKAHCRGKGAAARKERLFTEYLKEHPYANRKQRRTIRKSIKAHIKPDQETVDRWAKTFLHGRPSPFTIGELMGLVDGA